MRAMVPSSLTTSASTPAGSHPREPGEVDRGLGVAGALEHAAVAVAQREDVTGPGEVLGPGVVGRAARARWSTRSAAEMPVLVPCAGVDRDGERGALALGVVGDHQREAQLVEPLPLDGHADHAAGVADHERHRLGRHGLGGHDQVALVLAVGVVDDDHDLAARDGGDGVLDLGEGHALLLLAGVRGEQTFDVLGEHVDFEVDGIAGLSGAERGDGERVRDDRHVERAIGRSSRPATVRLMPSTVMEPFSTT